MNSLSLSAEDKEQSLISEITAIGNALRLLDPGSQEFAQLLAQMKRMINKMSDR